MSGQYIGKYKGFVRDNADPQVRGRIRCFCPQVMGPLDDANHWTGWAEACLPWLGGLNTLDFGSPSTKQQNNGVEVGVWMEFEGGDPDFPIYVGTFIPVPTPNAPTAQLDLTTTSTQSGGSDIENAPSGSTTGPLNPLAPLPGTTEVRFTTKAGVDLFLGSKNGGGIVIGPSGVHLVGIAISHNGQLVQAEDELS